VGSIKNDAWALIVSVSLGPGAVFLWGGKRRSDPVRRLHLESGDIVVWGGPARYAVMRNPQNRSSADSFPSGMWTVSEYFSKGKIDASGARQRMVPVLERRDAVIDEGQIHLSGERCRFVDRWRCLQKNHAKKCHLKSKRWLLRLLIIPCPYKIVR
jgi:hypothetical protein